MKARPKGELEPSRKIYVRTQPVTRPERENNRGFTRNCLMTLSIAGLLFAFVSFIAAFVAARALSHWLKRRRLQKDEEEATKTQSRQVRRAKARSKRPQGR